jgi:hypothetical protein
MIVIALTIFLCCLKHDLYHHEMQQYLALGYNLYSIQLIQKRLSFGFTNLEL